MDPQMEFRIKTKVSHYPFCCCLDKPSPLPYHGVERLGLFSGGFLEIGFILFIAFLLFGPKKLPEIARTLGKGMGELRRASYELRNSLEEEIRNLERQDESPTSVLSETVPEYGHNYTEPASQEPKPRS